MVGRARITESGTRASFLELLGISETLEEAMVAASGQPRLDGNPEMAAAIAANTYQIGYVGLGFTGEPGLRVVPVDGGSGCVPGTFETVENDYPSAACSTSTRSRRPWTPRGTPKCPPTSTGSLAQGPGPGRE